MWANIARGSLTVSFGSMATGTTTGATPTARGPSTLAVRLDLPVPLSAAVADDGDALVASASVTEGFFDVVVAGEFSKGDVVDAEVVPNGERVKGVRLL